MSRPSLLILLLFSAWALLPAEPAHAQEATLPSIEEVQKALDGLADRSLSEAELKQYQDTYQATLKHLRELETVQEQQKKLTERLEQAPVRIKQAQQAMKAIEPIDKQALAKQYEGLALNELEEQLRANYRQITTWQSELTKVNNDLVAAQARPERVQAEISANQARIEKLNQLMSGLQQQTETQLTEQQLQKYAAELQVLQQTNGLLRQKLFANNKLVDDAQSQRDLLSRRIEQAEAKLTVMLEVLNEKRRERSQEAASSAMLQDKVLSADSLLLRQNEINRQFSEQLLDTTERIAALTQQNIKAHQQADRLVQIEQTLNQQIAALSGSMLLSRLLQQQKQLLPRVDLNIRLADQIAELRLRQFELTREREALGDPQKYVNELLEEQPDEAATPELREELLKLVEARARLLEQLGTDLSSALSLAVNLQINQQQIQELSRKLRSTLDEKLFWLPSNPAIDFDWIQSLPQQLSDQIRSLRWLQGPWTALKNIIAQPTSIGLLSILLLVYVLGRQRLNGYQANIHERIGQFRQEKIWHTPLALLLTALQVVLLPLIFILISSWLRQVSMPDAAAWGAAFYNLGLALFVVHLFYSVLRRKGIAQHHFHWAPPLIRPLRRTVLWLVPVLLPLVFVIGLAEQDPVQLSRNTLGVLVMLFGCLALSLLLGRLMLKVPLIYESRLLHFVASVVLVVVPLGLMLMTALGYYYTSLKLADRFVMSLYLLVAWMLAEGVAMRILKVTAQRVGYERALAQQQAAAKDGTETDVPVEPPGLSMHQVNKQSLRLTVLTLIMIFTVLVYWVWADLLTVFSYLDGITLWEYTSAAGENVPISFLDVLVALAVVILTIILARNLPGLLEMLVLSGMRLRQGSTYAITTLLSYLIVGIGIIVTFSALGVSWEKLQWLVAALGVGLGFGLQEIFANFVSGIIILFERPARIGDTVTIGDTLSGTVSRIRIRATTITDFDRKEIIVPNKYFVTDRLINWSLTDTITRIIIKVGVAYGSDLDRVRELLFQIAKENPKILTDPEPTVYFMNFGNSTLDHELRVHVSELNDRLATIDELNRAIDRTLRQEGIKIAFNQVDVHLRNAEGLDRLVQRIPPASSAADGSDDPVR